MEGYFAQQIARVVYRGVTGSLASIGRLPVLAGQYFGQHFFLAGIT